MPTSTINSSHNANKRSIATRECDCDNDRYERALHVSIAQCPPKTSKRYSQPTKQNLAISVRLDMHFHPRPELQTTFQTIRKANISMNGEGVEGLINDDFVIGTVNIQGLRNKRLQVKNLLYTHNIQVLGIVDTLIKSSPNFSGYSAIS
ncbi:hypothetical protein JTB14_027537 [Gonioctena quinquepunctata]|nr:hypothetical protein JTB14_027537 [Gonioctena quinquepunctata]